ncbi:phosphatase PAP2 family protein [Glaciimonas immobilis]|uniref:Undecaprenyl-diphosphatase n=1 Tax=Glaciimonas immobilis TaxID=728004 RepID=A0A840RNM2_9BURK|nr:phosphatase PAP2 family protein [Glaciimonas immobilis]KAF3998015.1 phosphatase PAP2 family protein [Glaciimonas immobilis]MBB5199305.1 undecaprenyl-diphosphatase [Glaciimonas immobilis]
MWNNSLNLAVFNWLSQYTTVSAAFNQILHYIAGSDLVKGFPFMGVIWFFWFRDIDSKSNGRRTIIATLIGCIIAVGIARSVNNLGPFQPRPIANQALPHLNYVGLPQSETQDLYIWNSFPSDHSALFFALATGIFLLSRRWGIYAYFYVLLFIALPRIYLGLHYTTDVLAGAFLGTAFVFLCNQMRFIRLYDDQCTALAQRFPAAFQAIIFICGTEICLMFYDVRLLFHGLSKYIH